MAGLSGYEWTSLILMHTTMDTGTFLVEKGKYLRDGLGRVVGPYQVTLVLTAFFLHL